MVDQSAKPLSALDRQAGVRRWRFGDGPVADGLVRSFAIVVVVDEFAHNDVDGAMIVADELAEDAVTQGSDQPFDMAIAPWAAGRRVLADVAGVIDHGTDFSGVLAFVVEPHDGGFGHAEKAVSSSQRGKHAGDGLAGWACAHADECCAPRAQMDGDHRRGDAGVAKVCVAGADAEEVDGNGVGVESQGRCRAMIRSARDGWHAMVAEDGADAGRADIDAEFAQFPGDAFAAPGVVAVAVGSSQVDDQADVLGRNRRPSAARVLFARSAEPAMPVAQGSLLGQGADPCGARETDLGSGTGEHGTLVVGEVARSALAAVAVDVALDDDEAQRGFGSFALAGGDSGDDGFRAA